MQSEKDEIIVTTKQRIYNVTIGKINTIHTNSSILIVTSQNIANLYLNDLISKIHSKNINTCIINDGESNKNMQTIESILDGAFNAKLNRNSLMISLGGGVMSDMVGFASGIYQRGIDFINIPTTLLAMVDASVGGKCGINNTFGKNLVGLFHQPKEVLVDLAFLHSLPRREINAGLCEIVKIFACFDFELLKDFDEKNLKYYIKRAIELKAQVVSDDENEKSGRRALLNYGHTFGHAIELEGDFKEMLHGEAVSIGIIMANRLSVKLGILDSKKAQIIESLLQKIGLPTTYKIKNKEKFFQSFYLDKKSLDSILHFILLDNFGAKVHNNISNETLHILLDEFA